MAIVTPEEVKTLLQISDTANDLLIEALIPIVENDIKDYTNNFSDGVFPVNLKLTAALMINHRLEKPTDNISSEKIGDYSVSYSSDSINGYPAKIMQPLNKYRKAKWV